MYARKRIYNRMKRLAENQSKTFTIHDFYSEIMTNENMAMMIEHFCSLVKNIIAEGTAIPVSEHQMTKRKKLGLPDICYDTEEIKTITKGYRGKEE